MNNFNESKVDDRSWEKIIMKYNRPDLRKSLWQLVNSFVPYGIVFYLMVLSLQYSYWLTLLLAIPASGFLIRLFIIFHDCGHGSFFKSKKVNDIVGKIIGVFVFTPYSHWHNNHRIHHATSGDLDKRGIGDVWTLTVDEYLALPKKKKLFYRLYRNPLLMFTVGSVYLVLLRNRLTHGGMTAEGKKNVYITNIGLLILAAIFGFTIGLKAFLMIQLPIIIFAHTAGLWLFYVQHQFDDVYWDHTPDWGYATAAVEGSSFLKLPLVFQWFTGNIGFHHVHHLSSRIPNYNLARCHYENEFFRRIKPLTFWASFKTLNLRLWDETGRRMISFKKLALIRS